MESFFVIACPYSDFEFICPNLRKRIPEAFIEMPLSPLRYRGR
jgi:hypothetical protein